MRRLLNQAANAAAKAKGSIFEIENKLLDFRTYFNNHRTHTAREGRTPDTPRHDQSQISARLDGSPIVDPYFRPQWLPNSDFR
jgi:hypothetical protein